MTYKEIIKDLKAKKYQPIYLLHGDEAFYIDKISDYIENNVLTESEKSFNQTVIYGKEAEAKTVIDTASRYPMMAERQVVILKEAQDMKTLGDLQPYVERAVPSTILVICYKHKKFDSRTKLAKSIKAKSLKSEPEAIIFESKKMYDNQVAGWISTYLKDHKLSIEPDAAELVAEYLGTNLSKVSNELDKLIINVPTGTSVNTQLIQENIGISKDYNVFELQKSIGQRDLLKTQRIVNYFIANPKKNPLVVVVATLYNYFSKVYQAHYLRNVSDNELAAALGTRAFFVKDYKLARKNFNLHKTQDVIGILSEYDLRSKGVDNNGTTHGELLREMVYRILH